VPAPRDVTASPARGAPAHPTAVLAIICLSYFVVILDAAGRFRSCMG
jgi:hypothetical protein